MVVWSDVRSVADTPVEVEQQNFYLWLCVDLTIIINTTSGDNISMSTAGAEQLTGGGNNRRVDVNVIL